MRCTTCFNDMFKDGLFVGSLRSLKKALSHVRKQEGQQSASDSQGRRPTVTRACAHQHHEPNVSRT